MGLAELVVRFIGEDSSLQGAVGRSKGAVSGLLGPIGIAAAGAVVLGGAIFAVGEKFQGAFNKLQVGTGATGEQLKGLESSFKNVLAGTAGSMEQVEAAIEGVSRRTGLTGAALDDLAKKEVALGRITKTDVAANVEATTAVMAKFGVAARDQSQELDVLFKASQFSGKSVADLAGEMSNAEVSLHGVGLSFDQSAAIVAAFGKAGINTAGAFTGLRKEFVTLEKAGKDPIEGFRQLSDRIKNAKTDTEAFGEAAKAFGPKGIEMAKAIRDGTLDVDALAKSLASGKGGILETAANVSTIGGKFARLKNEALVALEPIGMKLVDLANTGLGAVIKGIDNIRPALSAAQQHVSRFAQVFRGALDPRTEIDDLSGMDRIAGMLGKAMLSLSMAVSTAFTAISGFVDRNGATFSRWGEQVMGVLRQVGGVFRSAFELIAAVVSVGVTIVTQLWDRFGEHLWSHIKVAVDALLQILRGAFEIIKGILDVFIAIFTGDWARLWQGVQEIVSGVWNVIVGLVRAGINEVSTVVGVAMAVISEIWSGAWNMVATLFSTIFGGIVGAAESMIGTVVGFFESLPGRVIGALGSLFGIGADWIGGLLAGLQSAAGGVLSWITGFASDAIHKLTHPWELLSPSRVTMRIGENFMAGLALGMKSGAGEVFNQIDNVAGGTARLPGTAGIGGVTGVGGLGRSATGSGVNITLHVAGSVVTERDLVAGVRNALIDDVSRRVPSLLAGR